MSALADPAVGEYVNRHFVAAFQKVATFQIDGCQKQGGNVATYFCTADGHVLHAIAGPVDGATFLQEARWANETYQLALLEQPDLDQLKTYFRNAHLQRLEQEHHAIVPRGKLPQPDAFTPQLLEDVLARHPNSGLSDPAKVHLLLAVAPAPRLGEVYRVVFESILNEKISTSPVKVTK